MEKLFVAGAGTMGSGIAQTALQGGYQVYLFDTADGAPERAIAAIKGRLERSVEKGRISADDQASMMKRIETAPLRAAADCSIVIEAVFENAEVKSALFKQIDALVNEKTMLASNTSSISISALSASVSRPERFIGAHFFVPAPVMKLVEIVRGLSTSDETVARAKEMAGRMGKTAIVVKDMPCFLVNRLVDPLVNEGVQLLEEGVGSVEAIDTGAKLALNHPMGPLELIDLMGLDVALAVMETLRHDFGDPKYRPSTLLRRMVNAGFLGKKNGKGFYCYDENGKNTGVNPLFK
ncbi:MAG: 3-hydroxybutyryl-CoA dehydrogenase [Treponema sp.]|nr:3-hydroxybutyryl-CoA dehydrogenase [Treponema sp.]